MAEPAHTGVMALGHPQQRRHDPPDGARRAVHVGLELRPGPDPHRRAVDPHRAHVDPQLGERQPVAAARVDERADDRLRGAAGRQAALELALPRVQRGAARRRSTAPGAGRRRCRRPCARSRRARAWPAGSRPAGGAWPSSRSGRGAAACGGTPRRSGRATDPSV